MIYILHTHNRDKNENKKDNHDNDANKDEDKDNARIVKDDGVRLTLANNKNKNKTKNLFLILSKRHRTTLAVEQKRKQNPVKNVIRYTTHIFGIIRARRKLFLIILNRPLGPSPAILLWGHVSLRLRYFCRTPINHCGVAQVHGHHYRLHLRFSGMPFCLLECICFLSECPLFSFRLLTFFSWCSNLQCQCLCCHIRGCV